MKIFLFFIYICFFLYLSNIVNCGKYYIDSEYGAITDVIPDKPGYWPNQYKECENFIDLQFIEHSGLYHLEDWFYIERIYPSKSSFTVSVTIFDGKTLITEAYKHGVWSVHNDCEEIYDLITKRIVYPVVNSMKESKNGYLTARAYGLKIEFMCKYDHESEYHLCKGSEVLEMTSSRKNTIHERRSKIKNKK